MKFTHLHLHTEYSLLDGANKIAQLAKVLKEQGVESVAITDHGNMFGAIEFYKVMKANGIKPIIGIEAYIHNSKDLGDKSEKHRFHVILLAKNEIGYKNLMKLSSLAYLDGFYRNPRINKEILRQNSEGIICSSACLAGEVNFHLNLSKRNIERGAKGYERAKEVALEYKEIFGDDFYLEIMRHGILEQQNIDEEIIKIAKETGIKLVATNDAHYINKDMAKAHEVFMCIAMGKTINDPTRLKHGICEFYVKSPQEMMDIFADIPQAIENTQEIVNKCNLELNLGNATPPNFKFTLEYAKKLNIPMPNPESIYNLENDIALFEYLSKQGLEDRLRFINESEHEQYRQRLEKEIKTINEMKFPGYMLIVSDFINQAKNMGIPVGPGRGSAAGSLVAYCLKITDINPIPYNLLFERFLNPERVSMPDIDVDFCQFRRSEVIDYVINKYGKYNVAQVATFGKLLARGVIRDVARVIDMPLSDSDKMAKLVPEKEKTLAGAFDTEDKLRDFVSNNPSAKEVWDYALALEGLNRNAGMHAAGIVISNEELWNKTPLFRQTKGEDGQYITQYSKDFLEDVDLIKFDFLGLKTLTVIDNAIKLIKKTYNKNIVWENIDFNEPQVYKTIQSGNTLGIFQIESSGMQDLSMKLKPDNFEDIIAMIALYRPGPLESGMIDDFIKRKHKEIKTTYIIDDLKDILEPTYGVIVYQEQVMQIVQKIGGFTLGGADIIRRAMSKKKEKEMKELKYKYLLGAKNLGYDTKKADELFELIMKFAEYGFNKSHSAAYAYITFQTAYLKTFYPAEFMAALLTSEEDNLDKVAKYIDEIKRLNIDILAPDINLSYREFSVIQKDNKKAIVFGLGAIKGVGLNAIENILKQREDGKFQNLSDFISKIDNFYVNKRTLESLILTGAMSCFGINRQTLFNNLENITETCKKSTQIKKEAQESLFGMDEMVTNITIDLVESKEFELKDILKYEKEILGIYISGHPLGDFMQDISKIEYTPGIEFENLQGSCETTLVGKIEDFETKITKNGKKFGIIKVIDISSNFEILVFDKTLNDFEEKTKYNFEKPFVFRVKIFKEENGLKITLLNVSNIDNNDIKGGTKFIKNDKKPSYQPYEYELDIKDLSYKKIGEIYDFITNFCKNKSGNKKLIFKVKTSEKILIFNTPFIVDETLLDMLDELIAV